MAAVEVLYCGGGGCKCIYMFYVCDCDSLQSKSCEQIKMIVVYELIYQD